MGKHTGGKVRTDKKQSRFTKYLKMSVVILFVFVFCAAWAFDADFTMWPFDSVVLGDRSIYMRYLAYNRGTDFTVFNEAGQDSDAEQHNFFIMTATPKTYEKNGIAVSVNKNGSVTVQGVNEGTLLEVPLNGKAQTFPEGMYYFNMFSESSDDISDISVEWVETIASEDTSNETKNILDFQDNSGEIECISGANYMCVLKIPEGADISDGVTFYPVMSLEQTEYISSDSDESNIENCKISYLRAIYPYEDQKYGKVFTIKKEDFLSLSDKEWSVFQNNIRYLYFPQYTYISILFEDGTGIQFNSKDPTATISGNMDSAGVIIGESI